MRVKSFRDLRVWQNGMSLVEDVYRLTQTFPPEEKFGLMSQMRRAAVSIPSNIAEGYVRESIKEYLNHLSFAQASLAELQTQLEISQRLQYIASGDATACNAKAVSLAKQLYALRNSLHHKTESNPHIPTPTS